MSNRSSQPGEGSGTPQPQAGDRVPSIAPATEPGRAPPTGRPVTQLLADAQRGDAAATNELFPIVYEELRTLASRFLHDERTAHTLQATALVHEAYLRLVGPAQTPWENRAHFFGAAAKAIRRILIDHARTRSRVKRGGGGLSGDGPAQQVPLDEGMLVSFDQPQRMIDFDGALARLAEIDPQKSRVVELRFFAGLTVEQTALALGVSASTVARDWQFARVWLFNELRSRGEGES
ncbi:MAG: sigma-70 family RNA polymerase sigma factor [Phycisphaerales bacterium]|nr:sigma-70 family RNA polymerase sigma factor [Phycisphaerales bacterium]